MLHRHVGRVDDVEFQMFSRKTIPDIEQVANLVPAAFVARQEQLFRVFENDDFELARVRNRGRIRPNRYEASTSQNFCCKKQTPNPRGNGALNHCRARGFCELGVGALTPLRIAV